MQNRRTKALKPNVFLGFQGLSLWVLFYYENCLICKSSCHLPIFLEFNYTLGGCQVFWGGGREFNRICSLIDTYIKDSICRCFDNGRVQIICPKAVFVVILWSVSQWLVRPFFPQKLPHAPKGQEKYYVRKLENIRLAWFSNWTRMNWTQSDFNCLM